MRQRLERLLEDADKGTARPDRETVRAVDDDLHGAIANMAGNSHLAQIIHSLRRQTQIFDLRSMPERLTSTCREHLTLIDLLEQGRGEEAAEAMREHLDRVRRQYYTETYAAMTPNTEGAVALEQDGHNQPPADIALARRLFDELEHRTSNAFGFTRPSFGLGEQIAHDMVRREARQTRP
ncbi:FCD domain-containing protein [uncultured Cohaesibacter sp.]|uniref:FCD domain-containing protein n=1 Tax=uncultured Cohaesibacter sp. TaxID=1002546 RepID=UPI0029C90E7D|nr:FCD domain-containing protein [uncultured Cohaesibacter sp.]